MANSSIRVVPTGLRQWWWGLYWRRCRAGLPWFWPARPIGRDAMVEARRIVRWHFGRDHHPVRRKLAQLLVTLAWLPAVLINLRMVRLYLGPAEMRKRVAGAVWAAIRHNILPTEYFAYGLWLPDRKMNIDNYLYSNECARLFKVLNRPSTPDPIEDKLAFHHMCQKHAIPTPAVLATFAPTGVLLDFDSRCPPKRDLFVKATTGGSRAECFRWDGIGFKSSRDYKLKRDGLSSYLAHRSRTENLTLIVQPALSNHPDLGIQSSEALACARLVTGCSPDGEVTPIFCIAYFGLPGEITSHSNWVTLIDVANGRPMPPPQEDAPGMSMYRYRDLVLGDHGKLPDWDSALRYVKAAHQLCSNFVFVGWDLTFTSHGPMILEGNGNWEAASYQTLRGEPLGHTRFVDILAAQLRLRLTTKIPLKRLN